MTMRAITFAEFKQISELLYEQCGIYLNDDQDYLVQTRLSHFADNLGLANFTELATLLRTEPEKLLPTVINLMTTNETLWFRDESCWNALEKDILPRLFKQLEDTQQDIKIWIAGCSTGQEAYSLAILIDELSGTLEKPALARRFYIQAMDISQTALEIAKTGRYNDFEIKRGLSLPRRDKYFDSYDDNVWVLRPNIRLRVHFDTVNLTRDFSNLGRFDLILCRNVTIYFTQEMRYKLLSTMTNMLTKQGVLLLGATESVRGRKGDFNTVEFEGCIYLKAKKPSN
jgi:chemotaxis protein methyltransferase CheR